MTNIDMTYAAQAGEDAEKNVLVDPIMGIPAAGEPDWMEDSPQSSTCENSESDDNVWGYEESEAPPDYYFTAEEEAMYAEMKAESQREFDEEYDYFSKVFPIGHEADAKEAWRRHHAGLPDACAWNQNALSFTRLRSKNGRVLSKRLELEGNVLVKKLTPAFGSGSFVTERVHSLLEFCDVLKSCGVDQALMYSVSNGMETGEITTKKLLPQFDPTTTAARIKTCFQHPIGPGIVCLDYDPKKGGAPLARKQLVDALLMAMPVLADTAMVWGVSAGSCVFDLATGSELRGEEGQRLYMALRHASDIPRFLEVLNSRLWLLGMGHIEVSASGSKLKRTIVDLALGNPVQPDFSGGASCGAGLVQKRPEPIFLQDGPLLDSRFLVPNLTKLELQNVSALIQLAEKNADDEAKAKRAAWLEARGAILVANLLSKSNASPNDLDALTKAEKNAKRILESAADACMLHGAFLINLEDGTEVSVAEIVRHKDRYEGSLTYDPIELDYDGGRLVGKLYLNGKTPILYSMAHGGATYELEVLEESVELIRGRQALCVEKTLEIMRDDPSIFDSGPYLVSIENDGQLNTFTPKTLALRLGLTVRYFSTKTDKDGEPYQVRENPPEVVASTIIELSKGRQLKSLSGVVTVPLMLPDGRLLTTPGYDSRTGLYLKVIGEGWGEVPESPSSEQLKAAYNTLWKPFSEFPWASQLDASVAFTSLLTAIVRRGMEIAPCFGFDAPSQASGKSIAAVTPGVLALGSNPGVTGYPSVKSDEEMGKLLLSKAMIGASAFVIDNVVGCFDSTALAAAVTSGCVDGRILGKSLMTGSTPLRMMTMLSGNNMILSADMSQRILVARIDAKEERPDKRGFAFEPVNYTLQHRPTLVVAGLTILQGFVKAGMPHLGAGTSRFAEWDRLVRQCVIWLGQTIDLPLSDPIDVIDRYREADPDQESFVSLLLGWKDIFGFDAVTVQDVLDWFDEHASDYRKLTQRQRSFWELIMNAASKGTLRPTPNSVGMFLRFKKERVSQGMRLEKAGQAHGGVTKWRLVQMP